MTRSTSEITTDIATLEEFRELYRAYYAIRRDDGASMADPDDERSELRRRLHRILARADRALTNAHENDFGIAPPPAIGGPPRIGLTAAAFAYDEPLFRGHPPIYETVLDRIEVGLGALEDELAVVRASPSAGSTHESASREESGSALASARGSEQGDGAARRGSVERWRRRGGTIATVILAPLLVGLLVVLITRWLSSSPGPPAHTEVQFVRPFLGDELNTGLHAQDQGAGKCQPYSQGDSGNPEAVRCYANHGVFDPCWLSENHQLAACLGNPLADEATIVRLNKPLKLPKKARIRISRHLSGPPWALALTNGAICVWSVGAATESVAGQRVNYGCGGTAFTGETDPIKNNVVIGTPNRAKPLWSVQYVPAGSGESMTLPVRTAWY